MDYGFKNYHNKADTVRKSVGKQKKNSLKSGKQTRNDVYYPANAIKKSQAAVQTPAKKTDKKMLNKPYRGGLAFPEKGEVSLFKNNNQKVSVSIGISSS